MGVETWGEVNNERQNFRQSKVILLKTKVIFHFFTLEDHIFF